MISRRAFFKFIGQAAAAVAVIAVAPWKTKEVVNTKWYLTDTDAWFLKKEDQPTVYWLGEGGVVYRASGAALNNELADRQAKFTKLPS